MKPSLAKSMIHFRRAAPWLLFAVWLAASAVRLWAMEVEAVRAGTVCSAAIGPRADKGISQWIQELLR